MPRTAKILSARAVSELRWKKTSVDKQGNPIPTPYPVGGARRAQLNNQRDKDRVLAATEKQSSVIVVSSLFIGLHIRQKTIQSLV